MRLIQAATRSFATLVIICCAAAVSMSQNEKPSPQPSPTPKQALVGGDNLLAGRGREESAAGEVP
jgi:hypothetical protein